MRWFPLTLARVQRVCSWSPEDSGVITQQLVHINVNPRDNLDILLDNG